MLHSGSRNVGNTTASFYDRVAGERPWCQLQRRQRQTGSNRHCPVQSWCIIVCFNLARGVALRGLHGSLNYLDVESKDGKNYLKDMQWCTAAALLTWPSIVLFSVMAS